MDIHEIYKPILTHFRTSRLVRFFKEMNIRPETRVLDVGGDIFFWSLAAELGLPEIKEITILNIYENDNPNLPSNIRWEVGDARKMNFQPREFDVVFSNSVIEHLGDAASQSECASEIRRVAKSYWVQTPDPRFPIEPHYLTPFIHWIPRTQRSRFLRYGTVWGWIAKPSQTTIRSRVNEIRLIPPQEFRSLFPDSKILIERFAGLPKSMIAFRRAAGQIGGFGSHRFA